MMLEVKGLLHCWSFTIKINSCCFCCSLFIVHSTGTRDQPVKSKQNNHKQSIVKTYSKKRGNNENMTI